MWGHRGRAVPSIKDMGFVCFQSFLIFLPTIIHNQSMNKGNYVLTFSIWNAIVKSRGNNPWLVCLFRHFRIELACFFHTYLYLLAPSVESVPMRWGRVNQSERTNGDSALKLSRSGTPKHSVQISAFFNRGAMRCAPSYLLTPFLVGHAFY